MTAVLGVDGGGSRRTLCDENGTLIGAQAPPAPSNWETVGLRGASDSIGDAIRRAMDGSPCAVPSWARPCSGSPVDWPSDVPRLEERSGLRLGSPPAILNDSFMALRGVQRRGAWW